MTVKILHPTMPFNCLVFLPMAVTLAILSINSSHKWTTRCLLPACLIIPVVAFVSARYGIGPAGLGPLTFGLFLSTVSIAFFAYVPSKNTRYATYAAAVCAIVVACFFGKINQTVDLYAQAMMDHVNTGEWRLADSIAIPTLNNTGRTWVIQKTASRLMKLFK